MSVKIMLYKFNWLFILVFTLITIQSLFTRMEQVCKITRLKTLFHALLLLEVCHIHDVVHQQRHLVGGLLGRGAGGRYGGVGDLGMEGQGVLGSHAR